MMRKDSTAVVTKETAAAPIAMLDRNRGEHQTPRLAASNTTMIPETPYFPINKKVHWRKSVASSGIEVKEHTNFTHESAPARAQDAFW